MTVVGIVVIAAVLIGLGAYLGAKLNTSAIDAVNDIKRKHEASIISDASSSKLKIEIVSKAEISKIAKETDKELERELNK